MKSEKCKTIIEIKRKVHKANGERQCGSRSRSRALPDERSEAPEVDTLLTKNIFMHMDK